MTKHRPSYSRTPNNSFYRIANAPGEFFVKAAVNNLLFQFQITDDIEAAVKLELQLRSELEFVS